MNKKNIFALGLTLLVIYILVSVSGCFEPQQISAEQAIYAQINMNENIQSIIDDMADCYADYLAFQMSQEEFKSNVISLQKRIKDIERDNNYFNKKYIINPEETSKELSEAVKGAENARVSVETILNKTVVNNEILSMEEIADLYVSEGVKMYEGLDKFKKHVEKRFDLEIETESNTDDNTKSDIETKTNNKAS
ncbi:MAG: hypothetical protein PHN69_05890 [Candidatus Pacebacteria bacterium]|nr:hypothetical protein [Candidatus Paceibacterota bacterium]